MGGKLLATAEAGYMVTPHADVYYKAALCTQHMGRSLEPDYPHEKYDRYVDSLVYTYRLSPVFAVMLAEQVRKLDRENLGRRQNVKLFRERMSGVRIVSFPAYAPDDDPVYHMLTMNFDADYAGIRKSTFFAAVGAEGAGCFQYIPSPIPTWPRLHWQTYDGPKVMWTEALRQSGIDYRAVAVPNCERKIARSVEMGWNYVEPSEEKMSRLASVFQKVEENLPALRDWERANAR